MELPPRNKNQITVHGTLVRIHNEGILLRGEAGVGKSSLAVEIMADGGRLVADDVVVIERIGNKLFGTAPPRLRRILAVPELGMFDVREVIGGRYYTRATVITRCVDLGCLSETPDGRGDAEFHGLRLPRTYRKVERSHKVAVFLGKIDPQFARQSEARFLQGHGMAVASTGARRSYVTRIT